MELAVSIQQFDRGEAPNLMSSEISPEDSVQSEHEVTAEYSPAGMRSLVLEASSAGLRFVDRVFESVRERLDGGAGLPSDPTSGRALTGQPRGLVLRPALLGFAAMLAIAVGASLPSSPFKLEMPGVWFFGVPSSGGPSRWGVYFVLAAVYGGLLLLMRVWWGMTRLYSRCPGVPLNRMMWVFALWSLPMLVIAPLFSRDAYSYAAQGEMVSHHMNPYLYGPFELGNNSYTAPVDNLWGNAPAPYGPLFLQLDGLFARVTFHNELATIVLLRLLSLVGVLLIAACVPRLARLYHRDGAEVFTLMVLNPVTVLHLIGGAHNDALMLGLLIAGLTAAKEKRPIVGIVLCALATAIKAPAAVGMLYVGWSWLGSQASTRDRIRPVVTAGLIGAGVLGFFSYVSGLGWGWVTILGTPGAVRSWTAPTTSLALVFAGIAHFAHIGVGLGGVLTATRFLGLLTATVAAVWLLLNSDRIGTLKALGITLLLFVVLGPVVQPWYLSWGLILLAPVALGRLRSLIIGLSMVTAFIELPGGTQLLNSLIHGDPLLIVLTLLWILVVLTVPLATWERREPAPPGGLPVGAAPGAAELASVSAA
jgi:alpha-1,6-mannosyltransferase